MLPKQRTVVAALLAMLVTACGGGGSSGSATLPPPTSNLGTGPATCSGNTAADFSCSGIDLRSRVPLTDMGGTSGNDVWGWADALTGNEYALMGMTNGTAFVDVTDPENPVYLGILPTQTISTPWRDIKVYQDHAYIVAEYAYNGIEYIKNVDWSQDDNFQASFNVMSSGNLTFDAGDTIAVGVRYYPTLPGWARTNGWHDEILMAYSSALQPGGDGVCTAPVFPLAVAADYCLNLLNSSGVTNNIEALLIISGADIDGDADNGLVDGGGGPDFFADDLGDIFEGENSTDALTYGGDYVILENNLTFDRRPANGNDLVHVFR